MLTDQQSELIQQAFGIMAKYRAPDCIATVQYGEILQDTANLAAIQMALAGAAGDMIQRGETYRETASLVRATVRNTLRELREQMEQEGTKIRGTETEIRDIAEQHAAQAFQRAEQMRISGSFLKFVYYSISDGCKHLEQLAKNLSDEKYVSRHW